MFNRLTALAVCIGLALPGVSTLSASCAFAQGAPAPAQANLLDQIRQRGVLLVGAAGDPPYEQRQSDGKWVGYLPDLLERFAASLGVKIEFVPSSFTAIVAGLQAGKFDLAGTDLHETELRREAIDFSETLFASGTSIYMQPSVAGKYRDLESLNDPSVTIAVEGGSGDEPVVRAAFPRAHILALPNASYGDMVMQVVTNKVTATALSSIYVPALTRRFGLVALPNDPDGLQPLPVGFGFRKDTPELRDAFNAFLRQAKADGTLDRLRAKYLTPEAFLEAFSHN
jgi:ABC-type amino acid transport substrate-binding protein